MAEARARGAFRAALEVLDLSEPLAAVVELDGLRQSVSERAALKGTVTILRMFLRRMVAVPLGTGHVLAALHLHHGLLSRGSQGRVLPGAPGFARVCNTKRDFGSASDPEGAGPRRAVARSANAVADQPPKVPFSAAYISLPP